MDVTSILEGLTKSLPDLVMDFIPGGQVIRTIARAVAGTSDDAEASARIEADPALQLEYQKAVLIQAVDMARVEVDRLRAENEVLAQVNETMRAEAASKNWWTSGWRPYWGFVAGTAFGMVCLLCCVLAYMAIIGGKSEAMAMIPQVIGAFTALFGIPMAILGIASWHRGKMQRIQAGEQPVRS
ncbi:MAG: holin family protein [Proteobacteria bacterium]|nr:holin family protein [Pseudomonadota bacterium]